MLLNNQISKSLPQKLRSIWVLTRPIPLVAWSGCAILLGLAPAIKISGKLNISIIVPIFLMAWLLQGLLSHAANDLQDWASGTDQNSPGILSGGSGVLRAGLFGQEMLKLLEKTAALLAILLSIYFLWLRGPVIIGLLLIGLWSGYAYSKAPFRLAYYPLLGELLCAFPAMVTVTGGTYYLITGNITILPLALGILHGLYSIAWLMIHHLPDIHADLKAQPRKITTPAWLYLSIGASAPKFASILYFTLALLWGTFLGFTMNKLLLLTIPFGILCIFFALKIKLNNLANLTQTELRLIALISCQAVLMSLLLIK